MVYSSATANKELKKILSNYNDSYKSLCAQSRDEYMKTLKPGASIPRENVLYTQESKRQFVEETNKAKEKAHEIIDGAITDLKTKSTDAPSTDAVNTISLLKTRDQVSESEINDLLDRYGDNVQSYRAIMSIARTNGLHIMRYHPVSDALENLENLSSSIDGLFNTSTPKISDGLIGFMEMHIDSAFPEG